MVDRWCSDRKDVILILHLKCPGAKVKIAPQWLKVAMEKLISNALKATPSGGQLTITTQLAGDIVHITVKDTGKGIPDFARPDFLKRTIRRPTINKTSGTGMGALIARFVALNHGGDLIWANRDQPCKGTELLMTLPVTIGDETESPGDGGK